MHSFGPLKSCALSVAGCAAGRGCSAGAGGLHSAGGGPTCGRVCGICPVCALSQPSRRVDLQDPGSLKHILPVGLVVTLRRSEGSKMRIGGTPSTFNRVCQGLCS